MAEITDEQRAALSAVGRKLVLPRLKPSAESRLARQAFEAYLDWNDRIAAHRERDDVENQMADVARALARLSQEDQELTLEAFGLYINLMMEKAPTGAGHIMLVTALRFVFRIGWAIVPPH